MSETRQWVTLTAYFFLKLSLTAVKVGAVAKSSATGMRTDDGLDLPLLAGLPACPTTRKTVGVRIHEQPTMPVIAG